MANDLIPPPSPAGRPQPAGTPRFIELPPEPTAEQLRSDAPPVPKLPPSQFRNRFGFLIGALGGIVIATALALAAVLFTGNGNAADDGLEPNWSAWQPSDTSIEAGATQIAEKVGAEYKHPDGKQLVLVQGMPMPLPVALRPGSGPIEIFRDNGVLYQLNGLGPNNSILGGEPSPERLKVIQREALELALYTFRYLPEVEMVVALLPPPPPEKSAAAASSSGSPSSLLGNAAEEIPRTALFYRPGDLKPELQVPLGTTVPAQAPTPGTFSADEQKTIDQLTLSNVFQWSLQESSGLLVLDRPTSP